MNNRVSIHQSCVHHYCCCTGKESFQEPIKGDNTDSRLSELGRAALTIPLGLGVLYTAVILFIGATKHSFLQRMRQGCGSV